MYLYIQLIPSELCKLQLREGLYSPEQSVVAESHVLERQVPGVRDEEI